jgi:hypothetical protein
VARAAADVRAAAASAPVGPASELAAKTAILFDFDGTLGRGFNRVTRYNLVILSG